MGVLADQSTYTVGECGGEGEGWVGVLADQSIYTVGECGGEGKGLVC